MKIGIIGAGFIARGVTAAAIKSGHEVMVSNTRGPNSLFSLTGTLGCQAGTPVEAAAFGDLVVVAIPLSAYQSIPKTELDGKIVLDANNYYPARDGQITELDQGLLTSSELLARHLPESMVVKAFNAIIAADIVTDGHARPAGAAQGSGGAGRGYGAGSPCRAAGDAKAAGPSRHGAHALRRPSDGTDGRGSTCRDTQQYLETSWLLSREDHRRFF